MKKIFLLSLLTSTSLFAQTITDSIATSLGEFVLVSSDTVEPSVGYFDETSTTADGGTAQYLEINSGARFASPAAVATGMIVTMLPNPAGGIVELNIAGVTGPVNISVIDVVGQTIYTTTLNVDGTRSAYLPAQTWATGTYIVTVSGYGSIYAERLIVL